MIRIKGNILLAPLTTFGIGGPARYFAVAKNVEDLQEAQTFATEKNIPLYILGGGSNVLIADAGLSGLTVKIELAGISIEEVPNGALLIAAAGENWDEVVARAVSEGLWGIENLSGIPGSVGGAIVQNIGAYGAAVSEVLEWADVWDMRMGERKKLTNAECAFEYRDSVFKHNLDVIVLRAAFNLSKHAQPNLSYRDLKNRFEGQVPRLDDVREAVIQIRAGKFPDLSREGSAGSFFKNPMLPRAQAEELQKRYPAMPLFDMPETSNVKVPLAWLLDKVLHLNGTRLGAARLYEHQPIVIAADRGARSADVVALATLVRTQVKETFGFEIEEEVKILE